MFLEGGNLSIATLVEEMKPVVAEMKPVVAAKDDFECRDKSKVIINFGNFWTTKILMRGEKQWFDFQSMSKSFKFSEETKMEDTKTVVTEK